ncbi:MAG: bifunctional glutamate N-acetyltransferase/amino-acid acetyltransferase ArgJ [Pseudomonadota bacterium]
MPQAFLSGITGFQVAAVSCGLKKISSGAADLGLIFCPEGAVCAGIFTRNRVKAAPVVISSRRARGGRCRAVLVNAGNANACTGRDGETAAMSTGRSLATVLGVPEEEILLASTGVIGRQLPISRMISSMPALRERLGPADRDGLLAVARAIMTTDTFPKVAWRTSEQDGFGVAGVAKGAGMIAPDMATMLAFIITDAALDAPALQTCLERAARTTFNRVTVDGDTSTNDTLLALASGKGSPLGGAALERFREALHGVCRDLARMIARDGEGATRLVEVHLKGARTPQEALAAARAVANSPLVKTAIFGRDANWGRIMAALGRSGAGFDPARVAISFGAVPVVKDGLTLGGEAEAAAAREMEAEEIVLSIDLGAGKAEETVWTCDLTPEYIHINADYRT